MKEEKQSLSERLKAELESVELQLSLASMDLRDSWEQESQNVASKLREIHSHLSQLTEHSSQDPQMEEQLGTATTKAKVVADILELKKEEWDKKAKELSSEACQGLEEMEDSLRDLLEHESLDDFRLEFEKTYDTALMQINDYLQFQKDFLEAKIDKGQEGLAELLDQLKEKQQRLIAAVL